MPIIYNENVGDRRTVQEVSIERLQHQDGNLKSPVCPIWKAIDTIGWLNVENWCNENIGVRRASLKFVGGKSRAWARFYTPRTGDMAFHFRHIEDAISFKFFLLSLVE